jgi:hypothetical protein
LVDGDVAAILDNANSAIRILVRTDSKFV